MPRPPDLFNGLVFGFPCIVFLIFLFFSLLALNGIPGEVSFVIATVAVVLIIAAIYREQARKSKPTRRP